MQHLYYNYALAVHVAVVGQGKSIATGLEHVVHVLLWKTDCVTHA